MFRASSLEAYNCNIFGFTDEETIVSNEPSKRQRRWKSENTRFREPQISNNAPPVLAKDVTPSSVLKGNLSGSNSVGSDDAPKEREG